jgi:hypothetical protein
MRLTLDVPYSVQSVGVNDGDNWWNYFRCTSDVTCCQHVSTRVRRVDVLDTTRTLIVTDLSDDYYAVRSPRTCSFFHHVGVLITDGSR